VGHGSLCDWVSGYDPLPGLFSISVENAHKLGVFRKGFE